MRWDELKNVPASIGLPTQGRAERAHLYFWIDGEEQYVAGKFDSTRSDHDESMASYNLEDFWTRQIVQYLDRAQLAFRAAQGLRSEGRDDDARHMEMKGQQALAKCMMTAKGCVESSIRTFGNLPMPGVSSGEVREWM